MLRPPSRDPRPSAPPATRPPDPRGGENSHRPPPMDDARPLTRERPVLLEETASRLGLVCICHQPPGCYCAPRRAAQRGATKRPTICG
eukprot:234308-Pyramimonas_sp.AAC.1